MRNYFNMLTEKGCRILYHGASVTVQKDGFRPVLHDLIVRSTNKNHEMIVNGVGGVGSLFSFCNVELVDENHNYDIIFYECFTGDTNSGITPIEILPFILKAFVNRFKNSQIVFLLNYRHDRKIDELDAVAEIYQAVADECGASVIPVYKHLYQLISSDTSDASRYFRDGVHPSAEGAIVMANYIWSSFKALPVLSHSVFKASDLIYKFRDGFYDFSTIKSISGSSLKSLCLLDNVELNEYQYQNTGQIFSYIESSGRLPFRFGSSYLFLGFLGIVGPSSPLFSGLSHRQQVFKFRTFDRNCHYYRPQTYSRLFELSEGDIEFLIDDPNPDFSICSRSSPDFELSRVIKVSSLYVLEMCAPSALDN